MLNNLVQAQGVFEVALCPADFFLDLARDFHGRAGGGGRGGREGYALLALPLALLGIC